MSEFTRTYGIREGSLIKSNTGNVLEFKLFDVKFNSSSRYVTLDVILDGFHKRVSLSKEKYSPEISEIEPVDLGLGVLVSMCSEYYKGKKARLHVSYPEGYTDKRIEKD